MGSGKDVKPCIGAEEKSSERRQCEGGERRVASGYRPGARPVRRSHGCTLDGPCPRGPSLIGRSRDSRRAGLGLREPQCEARNQLVPS